MLYKIIGTILMSDVVGLLLLMQLWLSKYEENELEESQERLENTVESMNNLAKECEARKLALSCLQKYEEKMNTVEPILSPPHGIDIDLKRASMIYGTYADKWFMRQQDLLMEDENNGKY